MTTVYPASKDNFSRPTASSSLSGHAALHDDLADAIEAIENKVGVNGDTTAGTVEKRLTDAEADITALENKDFTITFDTGSDLSGSVTVTNLGNVTNTTVAVRDDSHNHIISNVDGLQTALDGKLGSTAKAADSNLLDGVDSSSFLRSDANDTATGQVTFYRNVGSDWSDATIIVESANEQCSLAIRGGTTSTTYDKNTVQLRPANTGGGSPEPNLYFQNHNNTDQANIQVKNIYYSGTLVPVSSRTVKNTIQDYDGATAVIDALRPVTFIFNNSPHMGAQVGLVAEEVAEVDSKFVVDADVPSLNLNSIVGLAIAGLQEANTRITALEARIAQLGG